MIPYIDFLNHECVDVYYDYNYRPDNPNKPEDFNLEPPKEINDADLDNE